MVRRCGSLAVDTTPAGLLSAYTTRGCSALTAAAVDGHAIAGTDVASGIDHRLTADRNAAGPDQLLCRAARADAGESQELRQSHRNGTIEGVDLELLQRTLADFGEPAYRARQIWRWVARRRRGL